MTASAFFTILSHAFLRGRQPFRHQHLQGSFCSPHKDEYSAVLPGNAPPDLCVFLNLSFFMQSERLFFKKPLYFGRKSGMLYPTGAYLGYNASYPFFCAPIFILLFYAIFFIYLLIIYPACPPMRARRRRPYLHGPPPFFFCCKLSSLLQNRSDPGSAPLPAPDQRQRGRTHWNPV